MTDIFKRIEKGELDLSVCKHILGSPSSIISLGKYDESATDEILELAKLGIATIELINTPVGTFSITDICERAEMFNDDEECKACFAYKFCKLCNEVKI